MTKRSPNCEKKILKLFALRGSYDQLNAPSIATALGYTEHTTKACLRRLTKAGKLHCAKSGRRHVFSKKPVIEEPAKVSESADGDGGVDVSLEEIEAIVSAFDKASKGGHVTTTLNRAREVATWFMAHKLSTPDKSIVLKTLVDGFEKGRVAGVEVEPCRGWIVRRIVKILSKRGDLEQIPTEELVKSGIRANSHTYRWSLAKVGPDSAKIEVDGVAVEAGKGIVSRVDDTLRSIAFLGSHNVNVMALDSVNELVHGVLPGLDFSDHDPSAILDTRRLVSVCRALLEVCVHGSSPALWSGSQRKAIEAYLGSSVSSTLVKAKTREQVLEWASACLQDIAKSRNLNEDYSWLKSHKEN